MAIHKILFIPDPRLRAATDPITVFDQALQDLVDDMFETMYDANGVGLAGPQIGVSKKIAVIDITPNKSQQLVLINPEITAEHDVIEMAEGCLSVPGTSGVVKRANRVTVRAVDAYGAEFEITGEDLLAEALQHEIDHLNGVLYIDQLSRIKQARAKKLVEKYKRAMKNDPR